MAYNFTSDTFNVTYDLGGFEDMTDENVAELYAYQEQEWQKLRDLKEKHEAEIEQMEEKLRSLKIRSKRPIRSEDHDEYGDSHHGRNESRRQRGPTQNDRRDFRSGPSRSVLPEDFGAEGASIVAIGNGVICGNNLKNCNTSTVNHVALDSRGGVTSYRRSEYYH